MATLISIVEDNTMCQQIFMKVVKDSDELILAKVYATGEDAMDMINNPPDVAIVDIELPGIDGIELIKQLKIKLPALQCLVCSMYDDDDKIVQALEKGADGYILKKSSPQQIANALMEIIEGGAPMSPYVAKRVFSLFKKPKINEPEAQLSQREKEVILLIAQGLSYKQIAEKLYISHETVKKHLRNIYYKLHVQNKVEALNKLKMM
jgi:DNA-binding NarL/FixJ family response regulator